MIIDKRVKVIYIEDDFRYIERVEKRIRSDVRLDYLGHAMDKTAGVKMACDLHPDVVLVDLSLSNNDFYGDEGVEAAKTIRLATSAKIVFLSAHEDPDTMKNACSKSFASGYIFKSQHRTYSEEIYNAATATTPQKEFIKDMALKALTSAEMDVVKGLINGRIQGNTDTSPNGAKEKTIANQKTKIFEKLGLKNTEELLHVFRNW